MSIAAGIACKNHQNNPIKMNSIARISKLSITVAKRAAVNRTLFTRSAVVCGADKHAHDAHGHDDHEHHEHKVSRLRTHLIILAKLYIAK